MVNFKFTYDKYFGSFNLQLDILILQLDSLSLFNSTQHSHEVFKYQHV